MTLTPWTSGDSRARTRRHEAGCRLCHSSNHQQPTVARLTVHAFVTRVARAELSNGLILYSSSHPRAGPDFLPILQVLAQLEDESKELVDRAPLFTRWIRNHDRNVGLLYLDQP